MFDNFLKKKNYAKTQAKRRIFNAESQITGMGLDSRSAHSWPKGQLISE